MFCCCLGLSWYPEGARAVCLACSMAPGSTELLRPFILAASVCWPGRGTGKPWRACLGRPAGKQLGHSSFFWLRDVREPSTHLPAELLGLTQQQHPRDDTRDVPSPGDPESPQRPSPRHLQAATRAGPSWLLHLCLPPKPLSLQGDVSAAPEHRHCRNGAAQPPRAQPSRQPPCSPRGMGLPGKTRSRWSRCLFTSSSAADFAAPVPLGRRGMASWSGAEQEGLVC